jgi:hypothetical protein
MFSDIAPRSRPGGIDRHDRAELDVRLMMALLSAIVLVAVLVGPAGAQSVYQNDDPTYPVFEVNTQTEAHTATTWAEHAAQSIAKIAASPTGKAVQVAVGLYNVLVNKSMPVTSANIGF